MALDKDVCGCCKRPVEKTTERYVATKKAVLKTCDECIATNVTYPPGCFIPDGDATIC